MKFWETIEFRRHDRSKLVLDYWYWAFILRNKKYPSLLDNYNFYWQIYISKTESSVDGCHWRRKFSVRNTRLPRKELIVLWFLDFFFFAIDSRRNAIAKRWISTECSMGRVETTFGEGLEPRSPLPLGMSHCRHACRNKLFMCWRRRRVVNLVLRRSVAHVPPVRR